MKAPRTSLIAAALAALISAAPALAHGWPVPVGGGNANYGGPAGGGGTQDGVVGGGGTADGVVGGGGTGGVVGGGGGVNPAPSAGGAAARPTGSGSGASTARGVGAAPTKGKSAAAPWLTKVRVPWVPAFLPAIAVNGYASRTGTVEDALRLSAGDGGWSRDTRPVMVFQYDATNADHRRLLASLDSDSRVRTAAHLFNCFRVDVGAADKAQAKDARLSVFTGDGKLVGEAVGSRKLSAVYELLEQAWTKTGGSDLPNRAAKVDGFLKTKAYAEHFIPLCEAGIVCPDCGHERLDVIERVAELRARAEACDRAIDELRIVAKK
jgi:hypothetical protein